MVVVVRLGLEQEDWDEEQEQEQERSDQSLLPDESSESSESSLSLSSLSDDEDDVHGLRHDGTADGEAAGTGRTTGQDPLVGTRAPSVLVPVLLSLVDVVVDAGSADEQTLHWMFSLDRLTRIRIFISLCRSSDARHVLFSSTGTTTAAATGRRPGVGPSSRWGRGTRSDRDCLCTSCPDLWARRLASTMSWGEEPVYIATTGRRRGGTRGGGGTQAEQLVSQDDDSPCVRDRAASGPVTRSGERRS